MWNSPRKQSHVRLLKVLWFDECFVVARGHALEAVHQGQVILVDSQQLVLPHAVVQSARVEVGESLFGHNCTTESLKNEKRKMKKNVTGPSLEGAPVTGGFDDG